MGWGRGRRKVPRQLQQSKRRPGRSEAARCGPRSKAHPVPGAVLPSDPSSGGGGGGGEWGRVGGQEVEETKPGLPYPKAQCPAISPGLRLGPEPGASFCSLPERPRDAGTGYRAHPRSQPAVCSGAGGCRELCAAGQGSGKLARRARGGGQRGEEEPAAGAAAGGAEEKEEPAEEEREQGQEARRAST